MASLWIVLKKSIVKDLRQIPNNVIKRILKRIDSLAANPRHLGVKKLTGDDMYRIHRGGCSIRYKNEGSTGTLIIVLLTHKRYVYRQRPKEVRRAGGT